MSEPGPIAAYRRFLWLLTLLFAFRVVAQLASTVVDFPLLPPFGTWQSGILPYPVLLAFQILILGFMAVAVRRTHGVAGTPNAWRHRLCLLLGSAYFTAMLFRLVAGQTFLADSSWFAKPLPTFFHLVLATFLLTLGQILRWQRNYGLKAREM